MRKSKIIFFLTALLILIPTSVAYAYINNINTSGPDQWLDPGYRWNVNADAGSGNSVCIQWSTDGGSNWDRNRCAFNSGDSWSCDIPSNYNSSTIKYQFYKDVWDDNCAVGGNEWEWTSQWDFTTGPTAIQLQSLSARISRSWLPLSFGFGLAAVIGGTLVYKRKK